MHDLLKEVAAAAAEHALKDQSKDDGGPAFERIVATEGWHVARFVNYVEIGKREQRAFQGKSKPPAHEVRIGFELLNPKDAREIEVDGEKRTVYPMQYETLAIKTHEKAKFAKLFKAMAYGRQEVNGSKLVHMAQMLGEAFRIKIVHNTVPAADGKAERTYANMYDSSLGWLLEAPVIEKFDEETGESLGKKRIRVPEATVDLQLLLWDSPTEAQWNSIFIDGEFNRKDKDGNVEVISRNWIQQDIIKNAVDFEGSALQELLLTTQTGFTNEPSQPEDSSDAVDTPVADLDEGTDESVDSTPDKPKKGSKKAQKKDIVVDAPSDDPMFDLGLIDEDE